MSVPLALPVTTTPLEYGLAAAHVCSAPGASLERTPLPVAASCARTRHLAGVTKTVSFTANAPEGADASAPPLRRTARAPPPPSSAFARVPVVVLSNLDADLGEFFAVDADVLRERTAALADVAAGVLRMRHRPVGPRAVADARAALPLTPANFDDAVHLSPAGSDRLADLIFQTIKFHGL